MDRLACSLVELKFAPEEAGTMSFEGYGAVFKNIDAHGDVIEPGAFAQFLSAVHEGKEQWPMMLSQHGGLGLTAQDITPVGVWESMHEDGHGLAVKGRLAPTPRGQELYELMRMSPRPAIDALSIGYIAKEWTPRSKPEEPKRSIKRIDLVEVSVVSRPANRLARVASVKSIEDLASIREAEEFLCDIGLSQTQAKALIATIKGAGLRDVPGADGGQRDAVAELRPDVVSQVISILTP